MQGQLHRISKRGFVNIWRKVLHHPRMIPEHEKMHRREFTSWNSRSWKDAPTGAENSPIWRKTTGCAENSPVEISEYERTHERVRIFHQLKSRLCIIQESSSWRGEFTSWNSKRITGCGEIRLRTPISDHELHQGHRFTNSRRASITDAPADQLKAELRRKHTMGAESPNLKKFKSMKAFSTIAGTSLNSKSCSRSSQKQPEGHKWQIKRNSAQPDITSRAPKQAQRTSDN